ncbi:hypothetical protein ACSMXN_24505 [Jatrophihabitans sp. DSM 45814]
MNRGRVTGAIVATGLATGTALLLIPFATSTASASTTPVPVGLTLTGMSSAACPLPLNGSLAVTPGSTLTFTKDPILGLLGSEALTIRPAPDSADPNSSKAFTDLGAHGQSVTFARSATYKLSWTNKAVLGIAATTQTGKLQIDASAQKCVVAINLPSPSVSVAVLPSAVTDPVNGVVGGLVGGVNGVLAPVNGIVGSGLGQINQGVGGLTGGGSTATGPGSPGASAGPTDSASNGGSTGTGSEESAAPGRDGAAPGRDGAAHRGNLAMPARTSSTYRSDEAAGSSNSTGTAALAKPAPSAVEVAANRDRSALTGMPGVLVMLAIIALSTATACYARTFLLPHPQRARSHR